MATAKFWAVVLLISVGSISLSRFVAHVLAQLVGGMR